MLKLKEIFKGLFRRDTPFMWFQRMAWILSNKSSKDQIADLMKDVDEKNNKLGGDVRELNGAIRWLVIRASKGIIIEQLGKNLIPTWDKIFTQQKSLIVSNSDPRVSEEIISATRSQLNGNIYNDLPTEENNILMDKFQEVIKEALNHTDDPKVLNECALAYGTMIDSRTKLIAEKDSYRDFVENTIEKQKQILFRGNVNNGLIAWSIVRPLQHEFVIQTLQSGYPTIAKNALDILAAKHSVEETEEGRQVLFKEMRLLASTEEFVPHLEERDLENLNLLNLGIADDKDLAMNLKTMIIFAMNKDDTTRAKYFDLIKDEIVFRQEYKNWNDCHQHKPYEKATGIALLEDACANLTPKLD